VQVDILAIGAHPDDVEIGMGGTLAVHIAQGKKAGILDLTKGEMGTNGTPEQRLREGEKAKEILGCSFRKNLGLPDGFLEHTKENVAKVVEVIRTTQPSLVFAPFYQDKHPDHVACGRIVEEAVFISGLKKFSIHVKTHTPKQLFFFMVNPQVNPSIIVDVSNCYEIKKKAVLAHESQFILTEGSQITELNKENGYPERLELRDKYFGVQINAAYGEGFYIKQSVPIKNLFDMWSIK
ncbi:MAG: bacillithiol biosynthesis deacetylase BshB1, partial [Bacillota bacterium]|nr:bacillithiol biosynthesis deacetylase BshB1 [Bacillota bacterium]